MNKTTDDRSSSNMRRLRKGDKFDEVIRGKLVTLTVEGWVENLPDGKSVQIPVRREGGNITRRVFNGADRVKLV